MKSTVASTIGYLIGVALTVFYIKGIIHSYKKHTKIDFAISFVPPWGMFRGIESLWHKSPKKDYEKQMKEDEETVLNLLIAIPENKEQERELTEYAEKFGDRIEDYKEYRKEHLKEIALLYITFHKSFTNDGTNYVQAMVNQDTAYDYEKWDRLSKPIMDSIINIHDAESLRTEYKVMVYDMLTIRKHIKEKGISNDDKEMWINQMEIETEKDKERIRKAYKALFKEYSPIEGY